MALAAESYETAPKTSIVEEYGRSLVAMRHGGQLLVEQHVSVEYLIEETEMYPDFKTAVKEMLKNDKEFSSRLELSNQRAHDIVNGQTVNAKREPMVEVLGNGQVASSLLAEQDEDYGYQVTRDGADMRLAIKVDDMAEDQTVWGLSKDPKKALQKRPDIYAKRFGYKKGLVYLQTYSKADAKVLTGSYAIDCQYPDVLREILAEHNMIIPANESDDTWLDHAASTAMSPDEADVFARSIRQAYYKRIGESANRVSVDEFVEEHEDMLRGFFEAYYPDMARVTATGDNQASLQKLANAMLTKNSEKLKPEIIRELIRIRNASKLDDEAVKALDSIVRYATVEELRKHIQSRLVPKTHKAKHIVVQPSRQHSVGQDMHQLLAENVQAGVSACRSYPGCPGNIDLANDASKETDSDGINRQEAFGGKENGDDDCDFVSKSCPECGAKNVKTVIKKISATKKRIEGACGCIKVYKDE